MLLVTIGPRASTPDLVSLLVPIGDVIAILLPGHGLSRRQIEALLHDALVIEYLCPPKGAISILAEAVSKLERLRKTRRGPLLLINRKQTVAEISSILTGLGDSGMIVAPGVTGEPEIVGFSSEIAENTLLPRFFALLQELGIKDQRGLELLEQTFGGGRT
ncbi:hypothetical protein [Porphyrobacter sp. CACIAM 03H1]|uniref:hypothetical protein n=1 Tax=Porphyrobacter sp. CACIAM 03H1 TaxID=2003315 RepID=UPI000B5A7939|nr:hypothetical protein [Porphyrobacter sp. CACIAM 03H1]ASJ89771.1 hypothetical protein CBR61_01655 [Porphyrobacter sp. CACIAM 03H1]